MPLALRKMLLFRNMQPKWLVRPQQISLIFVVE